MSRISRVTQKIFASSASNNGVFGSAQAGTPTTTTSLSTIMGLAAWASGWLSAVMGSSKFPPLEEFQGISYVTTTQLAYLLQQGIAEYDAGTTYYTNNIVCNAGTYQLYGSVTNGNIGNALSDPTNWLYLGDLSTISNPSHFYSGGVTAGSAAAQTLATVTPSGYSLTNDGSTIACTAGFACPGACTFAIAGTAAKSAKVLIAGSYVNPAVNQFVLDETIFLTYNITQGFYVLTDAPTLGTSAVTNLDGTNFQNSGGNLAFGTAPVLPNGTTATTQAVGDNSTKPATTAYVDRKFVSSQQTISNAGSLTIAHGLGVAPTEIHTYIVNTTSEFGWALGTQYLVNFGGPFGASGAGATGAAITFDATNVYVQFAASANVLDNLLSSTGSTEQPFTEANWKLVVVAKP